MIKSLPNSVILPEIKGLSYEYGGMTPVGTDVIIRNGDARPYLPKFETQANTYFDTWGCTSFSFLNAGETYHKARYNEEPNYSDRDLTILSETKPRIGNSGEKVLQTAIDKGLIPQELGDWDSTGRNPKVNIEEVYYSYVRSEQGEKAAKQFKKDYTIIGEWVYRDKWNEASKRGVLQVYVNAWYMNRDGKYYNPTGRINHAVIMANYSTNQIYDSYEPRLKTLETWDGCHPWALKINIIKKDMSKPILRNNTLVILVEGTGSIGLYLDDKIIVDDVAKILSVFMARNAKEGDFTGGPVRSLTQEQWDSFNKRTLSV